jgi:hypothetical protein
MAEKTEPSFEEAVENDYYGAFTRDFVNMSPVQLHALNRAKRDFESKSASAAHDFDRKIARMSNNDFNALVSDVTYDAQRATSKMK